MAVRTRRTTKPRSATAFALVGIVMVIVGWALGMFLLDAPYHHIYTGFQWYDLLWFVCAGLVGRGLYQIWYFFIDHGVDWLFWVLLCVVAVVFYMIMNHYLGL